jgi:hyaluronoglucosaminidase
VIEGFYGPPWSHDARLEVVEFLAGYAMNAYVYAPKSDPKHRERWRDPYDPS